MGTTVILPQQEIVAYNEFRNQLAELKRANELTVFEYETPSGNKAARSYIFNLRKTKAAIEKVRKDEKQASLEYGRKVDAEAKEISAEIEEMIDVHQKPIDEIENREKSRIAGHEDLIRQIEILGSHSEVAWQGLEVEIMQASLANIPVDRNWQEFAGKAKLAIDEATVKINDAIDKKVKYDAEQVELERLRKEEAERLQKEREDKIAAEAVEKALIAEKEANAKREADKTNVALKNNQALDALVEAGLSAELAKIAVIAIAQGKIPNVKISY